MSRIGATLSGIERSLLNRLAEANAAATLSSLRMATGKMINYPSDDPSAFLMLSGLQSRLSNVRSVMSNVTAASSMISQAQTNLGSIRTQLNTIRTELLTDEGVTPPLTQAERDEAQANIDAAIVQINSLATSDINGRRLLDGSADFSISGRNPGQVTNLTVYSATGSGPVVAEKRAELTYTGDSRYAAAAATIKVTGNSGTSTSIAITTDDTLEKVASTINLQTGDTGVVASVTDNTLILASAEPRTPGRIIVEVEAGTFDTDGGNGAGRANYVPAFYGPTPAISGTVREAAAQAQLVYTGSAANKITDDATFDLTGETGSISVQVTAGDLLTDVRDEINAYSHKTGVTAAVNATDHTLTFTSVAYGTNATISIVADDPGTFDVTGGNHDGTANGSNAVAIINGLTYSGDVVAQSAQLRHREKDPEDIALAATITVTGTATSTDITIGAGDSLQDVADDINLQTGTTGVTAWVDDNDLVISSTATGATAQVSIDVSAGTFDTVSETTSAGGADPVTGSAVVDGNRFTVNDNGFHFAIEFAGGLTGDFDTITVDGGGLTYALSTYAGHTSSLAIPGVQAERLGGLSGTLNQLASGGTLSGLGTNTSEAIRVVDEALADLTRIEGAVDGFYNASITSASNLMSDLENDLEAAIDDIDLVDDTEQTVLANYYLDLASNSIAGLAILQNQRAEIVNLLQTIAGLT